MVCATFPAAQLVGLAVVSARLDVFCSLEVVGIYGSIKGEDCELIVLQHYTSAKSLYIQDGRRGKGRMTAPSRCPGPQSYPDATSGPSCPDAHYSDTSPRMKYAKEPRRE